MSPVRVETGKLKPIRNQIPVARVTQSTIITEMMLSIELRIIINISSVASPIHIISGNHHSIQPIIIERSIAIIGIVHIMEIWAIIRMTTIIVRAALIIRTMFVRHIQPQLVQEISMMHSQNTWAKHILSHGLRLHSVKWNPPQSQQSQRKTFTITLYTLIESKMKKIQTFFLYDPHTEQQNRPNSSQS